MSPKRRCEAAEPQMDTPQLADTSAVSDAQARRVLTLKRAFQRELGRKPTCLQSTLIDRAAVLTAKAEAAALDPAMTANDIVRLDGAASRARAAMFQAIAKHEPAPLASSVPSLGDILRGNARP